jgi:hypothetical protein
VPQSRFCSSSPDCRFKTRTDGPKFLWQTGSKWEADNAFYASLVIFDIDDGFARVEQLVGGTWTALENNGALGQQWLLERPKTERNMPFTIRIASKGGKMNAWDVQTPAQVCGSAGVCSGYTATFGTPVSAGA